MLEEQEPEEHLSLSGIVTAVSQSKIEHGDMPRFYKILQFPMLFVEFLPEGCQYLNRDKVKFKHKVEGKGTDKYKYKDKEEILFIKIVKDRILKIDKDNSDFKEESSFDKIIPEILSILIEEEETKIRVRLRIKLVIKEDQITTKIRTKRELGPEANQ